MRITALLLFFFTLFAAVSGQNESRVITWNSKPDCGCPSVIDARQGKVKCYTVETASGPVSVIEDSDVVFSIVLGFDRSNVVVSVSISNSTGASLEFDADKWSASHYRSEAEALSSKRPIFSEYSIPTRDMADNIRRDAAQSITLGSYMSDLSTLPTTGSKSPSIARPPEEPGIELNTNEAIRQRADQRITAIRKTALTAKYVAAGSIIKGLVYFRRAKKAPYSIISMPVGDTVYIIHFLHTTERQ